MSAAARARAKRRDRVVATGLAGAACAGVVGLVAARAAGAGAPVPEAEPAGVSQEALDAYAEQLTQEQARLAWYRAELRRIAEEVAAGRSVDSDVADWMADEGIGPLADGAAAIAPDTATYSS